MTKDAWVVCPDEMRSCGRTALRARAGDAPSRDRRARRRAADLGRQRRREGRARRAAIIRRACATRPGTATASHLRALRNEIVAFQVIVEADDAGIDRCRSGCRGWSRPADRILYRAPAADPTDYVDRPIQIFTRHYMHVTTPSHASWVYEPGVGGCTERSDRMEAGAAGAGERARRTRRPADRRAAARENQAIWIEIYIDRDRTPGVYRGHDRDSRGRDDGARCRSSSRCSTSRCPTRTACTRCCSTRAISRAVSRPQSRRRLSSARASSSRRAGARVRRADAAAAVWAGSPARTSRASAATKGPARARETCIAPRTLLRTGPRRSTIARRPGRAATRG